MFGDTVGLGNFFDPNDLTRQQPGLSGGYVGAGQPQDQSSPPPQQDTAPTETRPAATASAPSSDAPKQTPVIDRSRFAAELKENPALRQKIMAISAGENLNPTANQAVLETMMNRASMSGTTLAEQARLHKSSGINENGYYAGYNPKALDRPKVSSMIESNLDKVLSGSNVSNYATDNASGSFAEKQRATGAFNYKSSYGGETFFSPGKAGGSGSRGEQAYNKWIQNIGSPDTTTAVASNNSGRDRMSDNDYRQAFPSAPRFDSGNVTVASNTPSSPTAVAAAGEGFTPGLSGRRPFVNPFAGVKAPDITVMPLTRGPAAKAPQIVNPNRVVESDPLPLYDWQA